VDCAVFALLDSDEVTGAVVLLPLIAPELLEGCCDVAV
jgi:hypothetical protein